MGDTVPTNTMSIDNVPAGALVHIIIRKEGYFEWNWKTLMPEKHLRLNVDMMPDYSRDTVKDINKPYQMVHTSENPIDHISVIKTRQKILLCQ